MKSILALIFIASCLPAGADEIVSARNDEIISNRNSYSEDEVQDYTLKDANGVLWNSVNASLENHIFLRWEKRFSPRYEKFNGTNVKLVAAYAYSYVNFSTGGLASRVGLGSYKIISKQPIILDLATGIITMGDAQVGVAYSRFEQHDSKMYDTGAKFNKVKINERAHTLEIL